MIGIFAACKCLDLRVAQAGTLQGTQAVKPFRSDDFIFSPHNLPAIVPSGAQ